MTRSAATEAAAKVTIWRATETPASPTMPASAAARASGPRMNATVAISPAASAAAATNHQAQSGIL